MKDFNTAFLGIDCGLTYIKACVFDENGRLLREEKQFTPLAGEQIDMLKMREAAMECVRRSAQGFRISAVGLSGHGNGLYALDRHGSPLIGYSSMANSFHPHASDEESFFETAHQSMWSGQPMQILSHLKKTRPEVYGGIRHAMLCKDYIRYCLTGEMFTDYSDASAACLLDAKTCLYSDALFHLTGTQEMRNAFPEIVKSYDTCAFISRQAARLTGLEEGTPVSGGLFDVSACMLGAGAVEKNAAGITAGTWGITSMVTDTNTPNRHITQTVCFYDDQTYLNVVSAPTSCVNLEWFIQSVRTDLTYEEANRIAAAFKPDEVKMMYLPFLHEDMSLRGVQAGFYGMKASDTWKEMLRAVYEGVMLSHRRQLERLTRDLPRPRSARLSGGAANSVFWQQLFSDGLRLPVETVREKQVGALGACIAAAAAVGVYKTVGEAARHMTAAESTFVPCDQDVYANKYTEFLRRIGEAE